MTPEQEAAVRGFACIHCGVPAGDDCIDVSVDISEITGDRMVTIPIGELCQRREPHRVRMVHYRRYTDAVSRLGDLIE